MDSNYSSEESIENFPDILQNIDILIDEYSATVDAFESECNSIIFDFCGCMRKSVEVQASDIKKKINSVKHSNMEYLERKETYIKVFLKAQNIMQNCLYFKIYSIQINIEIESFKKRLLSVSSLPVVQLTDTTEVNKIAKVESDGGVLVRKINEGDINAVNHLT